MYFRDCECFLGLESLKKSSQKCAAIVWSFGGRFVVPKHMVPIAAVPPFTLCIHSPFFLYLGLYITTTYLLEQVIYIEIAKEVYDSCLDNICYRLCTLTLLRDHFVAKHVLSVGNVLGFFVWFVCCHVSIF
jgi:hypothetical protein